MCDISGEVLAQCYRVPPMGLFIATAGQRIDPSIESTFVWREIVADTGIQSEKLSLMNFTNWDPGQPDYSGGDEACVNIWADRGSRWNDYPCSQKMCFICEVDLPET